MPNAQCPMPNAQCPVIMSFDSYKTIAEVLTAYSITSIEERYIVETEVPIRGIISILQFEVGANGIRPLVDGILGYCLQK